MLTELKLSRAYIKLCVIPEDSPKLSVSLTFVDHHEVRMLTIPTINRSDASPLFWLELFDHCTNTSVDSYCCHKLKDAAPVFSDFLATANGLNTMTRSDYV